tara:strand:- start:531 stop:785 length:255 start_codon:yes stop_codon:yes gene_type:complete
MRYKSKIPDAIPEGEWFTSERLSQRMKDNGVELKSQQISQTLRMANGVKAGIVRRNNQRSQVEEWKVTDPVSFRAFFRDLVNRF